MAYVAERAGKNDRVLSRVKEAFSAEENAGNPAQGQGDDDIQRARGDQE